jgi:CheY-like chemotaxis protein
MIDILLISDQTRLHDILSATGKLPDGKLRVATSLNQGLAEITDKAPDILFLQNRLSGLSGFILVRHVKEETGSAATKIVLLTDGLEGSENSSADIELLTGVSDNELSDAISEIIGDLLGLTKNAPGSLERHLLTHVNPQQVALPDVADSVSISAATTKASKTATSPNATSGSKSTKAKGANNPSAPQATILSSSPPPIQWEKKRLAIALSVIAIVAIIAVATTLVLRSGSDSAKPEQARKATTTKAAKQVVQTAVTSHARPTVAATQEFTAPLPSFIPAAGIDRNYSRTNPGWMRYTSSAREFKIFHEANTIKAIQVLDRQPSGISPTFFSKTIQEIAKTRDYRLQSRELRGEYLVKKGKLSKTAEVILYKDRADTMLRAFVIHFDVQQSKTEDKGTK